MPRPTVGHRSKLSTASEQSGLNTSEDFGSSLVIAFALNERKETCFPVVYSEQKEGTHKTMFWKFPAGRIEAKDFPGEVVPAFLSTELRKQAAMNGALREFHEETSIPLNAIAAIELARIIVRKTHLLYVHLAQIRQDVRLPPAGTTGITGDRISYFTLSDIRRDPNFMPAHRELFLEITRSR